MSSTLSLVLLGFVLLLLWQSLQVIRRKKSLDNIPGPPSHSFLTGHLGPLFDRHEGWDFHSMLSHKYGPVVRVQGLFGSKALYIHDTGALQHIANKDGFFYDEPKSAQASNAILLGPGLLTVTGAQHRKQRKMLNPIFSADNMRHMTPMFYRIAHQLRIAIETQAKTGDDIDVLHWMGRAALEFIGQAGMGSSFDPLAPGSHATNAVGKALKEFLPVMYALHLWRMCAPFFEKLGPPHWRRRLADLAIILVPDRNLARMRDIVYTMHSSSLNIFREKRDTVKNGGLVVGDIDEGKDILSTLIKANVISDEKNKLSEAELLAQISTLLFAGTDTTSNALARTLQVLSENSGIQEKLRDELASARDYPGQEIAYDRLLELPLLDAVCRETLRLYSPVNIVPRETIVDVTIPLRNPIRGIDGQMIHEVNVSKGTLVLPNFLACNTSKELWGHDALKWRPERWLGPLPASLTDARVPGVYSNLMTFGGGGRSCIGFRFSQLEMKVVLSVLLESFKFSLTDKEIVWNWSGVSYPTMDRRSVEPSLVLRVEPVPARM